MILLYLLFFTTQIFAQKGIETKIAIEESLENRLRKVLSEITGTEKIIVIVNVDLKTEEKKAIPEKTEEESVVLPGVPIKKTVLEEKVEKLLAPLDLGETKAFIKRMNATIIVDKSVSKSTLEFIEKIAAGLLGIDKSRGDQLTIQQIRFQKNPFYWGEIFLPPNIFWLIGIILLAVFVIGALIYLFNPFKRFATNLVDSINTQLGKITPSIEGGGVAGELIPPAPVGNIAGPSVASSPGEGKIFGFINQFNIQKFITILQNENPHVISTVINYLEPNLSSEIFSHLPPQLQLEVANYFSKVAQLQPDEVKEYESKIKNKFDFFVDKESSLLMILDNSDKSTQEKILKEISQTQPQLATKLRKKLINFDDIVNFETRIIQQIFRRINLRSFASVLNSYPQEFRNKIIQAIPEGAARRLTQEIELSQPLPPQQLQIEKRKIVEVIRQLQSQGIIDLKK